MKKYLMKAVVVTMCLAPCEAGAQQAPMTLHYDRQADYFEESLPIGNGKARRTHLRRYRRQHHLSERHHALDWETRGPRPRQGRPPVDPEDPRGPLQGGLPGGGLAASLHVQGPNSQYFQPLGTLHIKDLGLGAITDYQRSLSLDSSIVRDSYRRDGRKIEREYFASHPDKAHRHPTAR